LSVGGIGRRREVVCSCRNGKRRGEASGRFDKSSRNVRRKRIIVSFAPFVVRNKKREL